MTWTRFFKNPKTALTGSSVAILAGVAAAVSGSNDPVSTTLIVTSAISALGGLGVEYFASASEKVFFNKTSRDEMLANGDLTRAVGRAIFLLILHESTKEFYGDDRERLETIGNSDETIWEDIVLGIEEKENPRFTLTEEDLKELSPDFLTQYTAAEAGKLDEIKTLTPEEWRIIVEKLAEKHGLILQFDSAWNVAKELHDNFASKLRMSLKNDFAEDRKAFASFQLRILGEILFYVKENHKTTKEILEKANLLDARTEQILSFLKIPTFTADERFWQKAFDLQTDILENTKELLIRTDRFEELLNKILEIISAKPHFVTLPKYIAADGFPSHTNYFTGRKDVLDGIKKELGRSKRASLHGISGLGKTSVLLEFAKRAEDVYEHIIFLRATKDNALNSFARVAETVDESAKRLEKDAEKAAKFINWLAENDGWLLLIDNVDVPGEVKPFLPLNLHGHILVSSNSPQITTVGNEVLIDKMSDKNSKLLLYRRARTLSDLSDEEIEAKLKQETEAEQTAVANIVKEFDGLPLALNLAGAYIHKFDKTFAEYENLYKQSAHKLLEKQDINDQYQNDSVAKAFSLAFETISTPENDTAESKRIAETAVLFLKTASFLHSEAIPLEIFTLMLGGRFENSEELAQDEIFLDEVFAKIAQFDLFEKDHDNQTVSIHRLVQFVVNNKIEAEEKLKICEQILAILDFLMPYYDYYNKETCERYFRQTETALENADKLPLENKISAFLYERIGKYQWFSGNFQLTEKFCLRYWKISENLYGKEHEETAISLNSLAIVYRLQGKYTEAIEQFEKTLAISEKTIGKNHPEYAIRLSNLAIVYNLQGRYTEAIDKLEEALAIDDKTIGKEHEAYASRLNTLAVVYEAQNKYTDATKKYEEALVIVEKTMGKEHPNYAISLNNLANVYCSQGRYDEAIPLFEEAVRIFVKFLGENHPNTKIVKENLENCRILAKGE